ncbi:MAG: FixH family protein [Cytophagales bacterium]|nr:FixH family protein [Cytophagales bacterium]MDW8384727.1 hypothetical protein [Flammeovirgaceae bacterium]
MKIPFNWGTGILIAIVIFMIFIISLGIYMITRPNDLIKKDYYEDEIKQLQKP